MRNLVNQLIKKVILIIVFVLMASIIVGDLEVNAVNLTDIKSNETKEYVLNNIKSEIESIIMEGEEETDNVVLTGDGTEENPYIITNAEEFNVIRNNLTACYKLGADVDFDGIDWTPIGDYSNLFSGKLDGDGKTIKNVNIISDRSYVGIFGCINGVICNLKLQNINVDITASSSRGNIAGLVGRIKTNSLELEEDNIHDIEAEEISVKINKGSAVGGLVGWTEGTISNIKINNVEVVGDSSVGGLVGYAQKGIQNVELTNGSVIANTDSGVGGVIGGVQAEKTSVFLNCKSNLSVTNNGSTDSTYAGGVIGTLTSGKLESSYSTGIVTGMDAAAVGGLVGCQKANGEIRKCYSVGIVTGKTQVGGLVGEQNAIIENCFSAATVNGEIKVGGLVGSSAKSIVNSYAIGEVKSSKTNYVGGIKGYSTSAGTVVDSYWCPETTLQSGSYSANIDQIKNVQTLSYKNGYGEWDFEEIWDIEEGITIAYLREMNKPNEVIISNMEGLVDYENGSGTEEDPYIITNPKQLQGMNADLSACYKLGNDIDLSGFDWQPIGKSALVFTGKLDGNNKKISNLNINYTTTYQDDKKNYEYVGLFGTLGGEVYNLKLQDITIKTSTYNVSSYIGSLAGTVRSNSNSEYNVYNIEANGIAITGSENYVGGLIGSLGGAVNNVKLSNYKVVGRNYVGGLIGSVGTMGKVNNTELNYGNVIGGNGEDVGGLVGRTSGQILNSKVDVVINDSYNEQARGGLAGKILDGVIENCYTNCSIKGCASAGGLVGNVYGGRISQCYSMGNIVAGNVGGLIGTIERNCTIENCFSLASVHTTATRGNQGGFIGIINNSSLNNSSEIKIINCYAMGEVELDSQYKSEGGFKANGNATVSNSYWCPETTLQETSAGSDASIKEKPLTLEKLKHQANYTEWDFDEIWMIDEGESTAYLQMLDKPIGLNFDDSDTVIPKTAIITEKEDTATSNSLTFDLQAEDEDSGVKSIEIYVDYELVRTITYDESQKGLVEEEVTISNLKPDTEYKCYIIVKDDVGLKKRSEIITCRTKDSIIPEIVSSNTELTNENVTITITAEISDTQIIEYRIADYPKNEEEDLTNVTWTTYTEPFELEENKIIYAHILDGIEAFEDASLTVNNIDKQAPIVSLIDNEDEEENDTMKLLFADEGVSGLDKFQYVIYNNELSEEDVPEYGEEISLNSQNEYEIPLSQSNNYVYVIVYDKAGNSTTELFVSLNEPLYLTSDFYTIDDVYCDRVSPDTTIKSFVEKLQTNGTLRVISEDGTDLSLTDDVTLVGTTYIVRVEQGSDFIEKEIVVVGDYNGDGTITIADVGAVNKYFLGSIPELDLRDRICDITGDNAITISDVGKLNKFFLGAIPRLINYPGE